MSAWMIPTVWKKQKDADERTVMTTSSIVALAEAVAAGAGITMLPTYVGDRDERLVRVGELVEDLTLQFWVLTHPDLRNTARIRALMDFLRDVLLARRALFEGTDPRQGPPSLR
jgi:DNA-binding transcriptional LysR family regulator